MDHIKKFIHKWAWLLLIVFCIVGLFYPVIGIAALVCMLSPSIFAFARGRIWCGNFCPRGSFNDNILAKFSMKKKMPQFMKTSWFKALFFTLLMTAFAIQIFHTWGDLAEAGMVFVRMIIITTLITIGLGLVYHHRAWCVICPMGTMAQIVTKYAARSSSIKNVSFVREKCINCNLCSRECPMGIEVLGYKARETVDNAACIKCNACIAKCPKKAIYMK